MHLNKKGSFSVITAIAAAALLLFIINGSLNVSQTNNSFLKMQAGREAVLNAENAVRIYDKASDSEILTNANSNPSCTSTLSSGELQAALNLIDFCEAQNISINSGSSLTITGKLICTKSIQGFEITEKRNFIFNKTLSDTPLACTISS